jgi:hypothetical protein
MDFNINTINIINLNFLYNIHNYLSSKTIEILSMAYNFQYDVSILAMQMEEANQRISMSLEWLQQLSMFRNEHEEWLKKMQEEALEKSEFLREAFDDIFSRHVREKNVYGPDGVITCRVFQKKGVTLKETDNCYYCMSSFITCRDHEISYGHGRKKMTAELLEDRFDHWLFEKYQKRYN